VRNNTCTVCNDSFPSKRPDAQFCSPNCRKSHNRKSRSVHAEPSASEVKSHSLHRGGSETEVTVHAEPKPEYTASSIQIKDPEDFDFHLIEKWAREYSRPVEWIRRSVEACRLAGAPLDYFKRRYLDGDRSVPLSQEVDVISQGLQDEAYRR